jgi:hypothetical protein
MGQRYINLNIRLNISIYYQTIKNFHIEYASDNLPGSQKNADNSFVSCSD